MLRSDPYDPLPSCYSVTASSAPPRRKTKTSEKIARTTVDKLRPGLRYEVGQKLGTYWLAAASCSLAGGGAQKTTLASKDERDAIVQKHPLVVELQAKAFVELLSEHKVPLRQLLHVLDADARTRYIVDYVHTDLNSVLLSR